jgi:hypothetical protein
MTVGDVICDGYGGWGARSRSDGNYRERWKYR